VLSTEEYPQQTQWQIGMARVGSLVPRGGWLITIGAVASIAGLLVGLYTTAPAVHHISSIVILAGGALIGAGLLLIGIGMLGAYGILAACVCMAVGAVYYFRKHKYERAI
jgi:CHASE2 domain-containing sensor protein